MKPLVTLSLLLLSAWLIGCAPTKSTSESNSTESQTERQDRPRDAVSDDKQNYLNLSEYLTRVPGLMIMGNTVTIRGINSFTSNIEPLFVIDGQPVGTSYAQVQGMVNVRDIDYVRVLKGSDASIYGVRGGNGVIVIVTKK